MITRIQRGSHWDGPVSMECESVEVTLPVEESPDRKIRIIVHENGITLRVVHGDGRTIEQLTLKPGELHGIALEGSHP